MLQNRSSCCSSNFSCRKHDVNLACGCSAYDIRSACETSIAQKAEKLIPTARGEINGKMGRVLRDTGATCIVVKQSFVDKQQYTGEEELCILIDGTTKRFPVAEIHLNTPYFHGTSKAVVMQNPLYDIIIGNVVNSNVDFNRAASSIQHKEPEKPICLEPVETQIKPVKINLSTPATFEESLITTPIFLQSSLFQELKQNPIPTQEVSTEIQEIISQTEPLDLRTFVTRGMQAKSQRPLQPLKTPTFPGLNLIVEEVKILQKPDKTFIKQVKYPILIPNQPVKEQILIPNQPVKEQILIPNQPIKEQTLIPNQQVKERTLIPNQQVKEQIFICNRQVENTVLNSIQTVDNPISEIFNQQVEIPIPTFEEKSKIIETQVQAGPHDLQLVSTRDIQANFQKPIKFQKTEILPETNVQIQRVAAVASVLEDETDESDLSLKDSELITHYSVSAKETYQDVNINSELPDYRKKAIKNLLNKYKEIFSDVPKITNLGEHRIHVISNQIVRCKPYPLPYSQQQVLDKEIDDMLAMNIIEPSEAHYASPLVIVKKSDGTNRVCVDYKRLNSITAIDPEPMTMADDIFAKLGGTKVYSKFDLSKGYYQLPMSADSMDYTTFTSHRGLYRFKVMPFGLTSAPMSFNRVMRKLLYKSRGLDNYLDDVLAHSTGWTEHLQDLEDFFLRIQQANLSLRPTKCQIGYQTIDFLGHRITEDSIEPNPKKLEKILESSRPETKTQIKSFLGLIGYYQQFLPNYSKVTTPLTDLLKKNLPNKITWGMDQETAFQVLKSFILNSPVLKLQT